MLYIGLLLYQYTQNNYPHTSIKMSWVSTILLTTVIYDKQKSSSGLWCSVLSSDYRGGGYISNWDYGYFLGEKQTKKISNSTQEYNTQIIVPNTIPETKIVDETFVSTNNKPKGKLLLNVRDLAVSGNVRPTLLDIESGDLKTIHIEKEDILDDVIAGSYQSESNSMIYRAWISEREFSIITSGIDGSSPKQLSSKMIDGGGPYRYSPPVVTKNGTVVFSFSKFNDLKDSQSLLEQKYFAVMKNSHIEEHPVHGVSPVAHPHHPSKVLYPGEEGLYEYDTQTHILKNLLSLDLLVDKEEAQDSLVKTYPNGFENEKISVSDNGRYLGWNDIDNRIFYVFRVEKWEPFTITLQYKYPLLGFWSQFSPNNRYMAVQTVGEEIFEDPSTTPSAIEIFDMTTGKRVYTKNLPSTYEQTALWLVDWISL